MASGIGRGRQDQREAPLHHYTFWNLIQTEQAMMDKNLRLVMPKSIRRTHPEDVQRNTILFADFITEVKDLPTLKDLDLD